MLDHSSINVNAPGQEAGGQRDRGREMGVPRPGTSMGWRRTGSRRRNHWTASLHCSWTRFTRCGTCTIRAASGVAPQPETRGRGDAPRFCARARSRVCFRTCARACVFRALSPSFAPPLEQPAEDRAARPGSTFGYGRTQPRLIWLGGVGFGGGLMHEERLSLLLRGDVS